MGIRGVSLEVDGLFPKAHRVRNVLHGCAKYNQQLGTDVARQDEMLTLSQNTLFGFQCRARGQPQRTKFLRFDQRV